MIWACLFVKLMALLMPKVGAKIVWKASFRLTVAVLMKATARKARWEPPHSAIARVMIPRAI